MAFQAVDLHTAQEEEIVSAELSSTGERVVRTSFFRMATRKPAPVIPTVDVLGLTIATPSLPALSSWFHSSSKSRGRDAKVLAFVEPATADYRMRALLGRADVTLPYGPGVKTYARLAQQVVPAHDPMATLDAILSASDRDDPLRVFLVGPGATRAGAALAARENIRVVGATERLDMFEDVNEACAEVVLAFGANALEWAVDTCSLLDVGVVVAAPDPTVRHKTRMGFVAAVRFVARSLAYLAFGARQARSLPAPR